MKRGAPMKRTPFARKACDEEGGSCLNARPGQPALAPARHAPSAPGIPAFPGKLLHFYNMLRKSYKVLLK